MDRIDWRCGVLLRGGKSCRCRVAGVRGVGDGASTPFLLSENEQVVEKCSPNFSCKTARRVAAVGPQRWRAAVSQPNTFFKSPFGAAVRRSAPFLRRRRVIQVSARSK